MRKVWGRCILVEDVIVSFRKQSTWDTRLELLDLFIYFVLLFLLFSNRSQKTWKCGKNISDTLGYRLVCHFFVLTTLWRLLWSIIEQTHGNMKSICQGRSRPLLLLISSAHATHYVTRITWRVPRHDMYFKRGHRVETQQNIELMTFAVTWSANIFVGCSVTPTFFFGRSLPFLILSIILKNKKNLCVGSFNYFSYTIQIGSNWYMDTGVRVS